MAGLLDNIERLINEHGSAVILKERIALANDKFAALEKKLSDSELRVKNLESENEGLRLDLDKAQEKIRNLEEKLVERHGQRLEKVKEEMLQLLAAQSDNITASQAAQGLKIGEQLAMYHLNEMKKSHLVHDAMFSNGRPTLWKIAQDGRAYLVTHGLLQ